MEKNKRRKRIGRILLFVVIAIFALGAIVPILFFIIMVLAAYGMGDNARKAYEDEREHIVDSLDSFIRVNHRLPVLLSEIGLEQNAISYDVGGVFYVTLLPDDPKDNSYILRFGYNDDDSPEYYFSKTGKWHTVDELLTVFTANDTLKRIYHIKLWLADDKFVHDVDSVRPNTSISFDYPVFVDEKIVFIHRYDRETGMDMKGWAVSDKHFISFREFGDWEYRDEDGSIYHKFWNYRENDSLIYRRDPKPKFVGRTK